MPTNSQDAPHLSGSYTVRPLPDPSLKEAWDGLFLPPEIKQRYVTYLDLLERLGQKGVSVFGLALHRLVLVTGERGTGKSTLAASGADRWARSQERRALLVRLNLHALASAERGGMERNIASVFNHMREVAASGCTTFVVADEVETVAVDRRLVNPTTNPLDTLFATNALLRELDDLVAECPNIVLIATSNLPELCDPAILDRVDVMLHVPLPNKLFRFHILRDALAELSHKGLCSGLSPSAEEWMNLAAATDGMSARQLRHLPLLALIYTAGASTLSFDDLLRAARDSMTDGPIAKGETQC